MRVITGSARGRKLLTLEGDDVRPTTDKVKESVFNIIQFDVEGARFLDLFAGSGQMGIEALSRGAAFAVFTDSDRRSAEIVKQNVFSTGFEGRCRVERTDALGFLRRTSERFDIAFLDPPYSTGLLQSAMELISGVMNEGAIVICESPSDEELQGRYGRLVMEREYLYGRLKLTKYIASEDE